MDLFLKDKLVVVTGGAKGIGAAIAETAAREGARVVVVGRKNIDNQKLAEHLAQKNLNVFTYESELTHPEACMEVCKQIQEDHGDVYALINNAGVNDGVGLEHGNYEGFMKSLHANLIHYYLMAHHLLPGMIRQKGTILNISSKTGITGQGNTSAYAAANGGRNALTREWAVELLKYGMRVNAIIVAECWTPAYETWIQTLPNPQEKLEEIVQHIPLEKRMTKASEIAETAIFLISPKSSHTTGQILFVDGGYVHLDRALANA
jgi:L-fucose dehydrogenase